MTTPLTFYPLNAPSTTIPTAIAIATVSGVSTTSSPTTPIGLSTNWGEIALSGTSVIWAASGTEPAPTGEGACLDASTLQGQEIIAGNWNGAFKLFAGTIGATYTGDLKLRAWRYNSFYGTYTAIGAITLTSQTFDHTGEVFVFPATSFPAMSFPTIYDSAYIDLLFNCSPTGNVGSTSTSKVKVNISSSATLGSTGNSFFASPGFLPQKQLASRFLLSRPHKKLGGRFVQQTPHLALAARFLLSRPHKLLNGRFGLLPGGLRLPGRARLASFQDSFIRANTAGSTTVSSAAGWWTTADGNTWSGSGSTYTTQISGNRGVLTGTTGSWHATLGGFLVADGDLFVRFSLSNSTAKGGLSFRSLTSSVNNEYRARYNNGAFELVVVVAGIATVLTTTAFTLTANVSYWLHAHLLGNTFSANLWADGANEPAGFMLTTTDSSWTYVNGLAGVVVNNVASGDTASFDHFVATSQNTTRTKLLPGRLVVSALSQQLLSSRYRLKSQTKNKKLTGRLFLVLAHTLVLSSRFNLATADFNQGNDDAHPATAFPLGVSSTTYLGENVIPVIPSGYYLVNEQILDTQPVVCTTPETIAGNTVLAGSIFTLIFDRPTTFTKSLLVNGSTVMMTFAIPDGTMIVGTILLASTLVASRTFIVTCTLAEDVTISTRIIATPFF